ncbi:MAG: hypothetical protein ACT4OF_12760 [Caulobacteraceae bacterium]
MRQRGFVLALAAAVCACTPASGQMPAAQASEVLNLFAAGRGPANVCSPDGRSLLRAAVRAYSAEMQRSGVAWPTIRGASGETEQVTHVDVSVMIAFAAGFVKASDFRGAARLFMDQLTLGQWPEIRSMRLAAREACEEVVALQQAAANYVLETARYQEMTARARDGRGRGERLRRQTVRLQRAEARMQETAAAVEARMAEDRL